MKNISLENISFKIHDVTDRTTGSYNAHFPSISRQSGNEIWREMFFFKSPEENEAGRLVPDLFLFLKKAL